jgi:tmRNA-binding protein
LGRFGAYRASRESASDLGSGKSKLLPGKRKEIKARDAALEMKRAMGKRRR